MDENEITLPYEFESADAIPQGFEKAYQVREDGTARLRMTLDGQEVQNLGGLRKAHEETNGKLSKRAEQLRAMEEQLGRYTDPDTGERFDPDEIRQAFAKIRSGKVKEEGDVQALVQKAREEAVKQSASQLKEERELRAKLEAQIGEKEITGEVFRGCAGTSADPDLVNLWVAGHVAELRRDEDGRMVAVVKGENGNPRLSMREGREGQNMTVEEYVKDVLPQEKPSLFPSKAAGGGPMGASGVGAKSASRYSGMEGTSKLTAALNDRLAGKGR